MVTVRYTCPRCGALVELDRDAYLADKSVTPDPLEGWEYVPAYEPEGFETADGIELVRAIEPSSLGTPRRAVVGWDPARLSMVVAVLEAHAGLKLGMHDIYLNIAGGLKITEPAADLAAAAALVSSLSGAPLPADAVFFGEIGLSGAVRPVSQAPTRMKEAAKLGFSSAVTPIARGEGGETGGLDAREMPHIGDLVGTIAARGAGRRQRAVER